MRKISVDTMKNLLYICLFVLAFGQGLFAQEMSLIKNFTNPTVPATLIVENYQGNITIEGYEGKEVVIDAKVNPQAQMQQLFYNQGIEQAFSVEEKHNTMVIKSTLPENSTNQSIDFKIKVPEKTTLRIKLIKGGMVEARNTSRLVEVDNQNGSVKLDDLYGWAVVNNANGNIDASFNEVISNKTMSFISLNGDVFLTFPTDLQANFRIKSTSGLIYNDFGLVNIAGESQNNMYNYSQATNTGVYKGDLGKAENRKEVLETQKKLEDAELSKEKDKETKKEQELKSKTEVSGKNASRAIPQNGYVTPAAYEGQANEGGPIYFISSRDGKIQIRKQQKKPVQYKK